MEPANKLDKYAVAVNRKNGDVIGHVPLGKSGKFAQSVFYILKSDKNHNCKITVTGNAIKAGGRHRMKILCQLLLLAEEKFIIILQEKVGKVL